MTKPLGLMGNMSVELYRLYLRIGLFSPLFPSKYKAKHIETTSNVVFSCLFHAGLPRVCETDEENVSVQLLSQEPVLKLNAKR